MRVINDKEESKNNKMSYGYDQKLLKEYGNIIPSLNHKKRIRSKGL